MSPVCIFTAFILICTDTFDCGSFIALTTMASNWIVSFSTIGHLWRQRMNTDININETLLSQENGKWERRKRHLSWRTQHIHYLLLESIKHQSNELSVLSCSDDLKTSILEMCSEKMRHALECIGWRCNRQVSEAVISSKKKSAE